MQNCPHGLFSKKHCVVKKYQQHETTFKNKFIVFYHTIFFWYFFQLLIFFYHHAWHKFEDMKTCQPQSFRIRSVFAGGLLCVSCVYTKFHMSTHTSVQGHRVWMTNQSVTFISVLVWPYHHPLSPVKTCYRVIFRVKVFRTEVHMSNRISLQNH